MRTPVPGASDSGRPLAVLPPNALAPLVWECHYSPCLTLLTEVSSGLIERPNRAGADGFALNRPLVAGYIAAFRAAAREFGVASEPDLNIVLRLPGAMGSAYLAMIGYGMASVIGKQLE